MLRKGHTEEQILAALRQVEGGEKIADVYRSLGVTARVPLASAVRPNQRWSMDFVTDRTSDQHWFRVLTVVDHAAKWMPRHFR